MIETLQENLNKIVKTIKQFIADDLSKDMPIMWLTIELLQSILGIGLITAATIFAEIDGFSAFLKPKRLVAYFGVDLSVVQSEEFTGTRNKMSKRGTKYPRRIFFTMAFASVRIKQNGDPINTVLLEFYSRKLQNKPKK